MKKTLGLLGAATIVGFGVVALSSTPAQAVQDCRTVTVSNRVSLDSGENQNNWATDTVTRKLTVCATETPDSGDWTYKATVADNGSFVTLAGDSPGAGTTKKLAGGFKGNIVGGFDARFTAPKWAAEFSLTSPPKATTTGEWVKTAFPTATFVGASVDNWSWTYTTCNGSGEKWINAQTGNSGDITEKVCAVATTPPATNPPTTVKKCEAYVYYGSQVTLCDRFANVTGKLNCTQVGYKVKLVNVNNDPWGLDGNKGVKGVGCEAYPQRVFATTPSPSHTTTPPVVGGSYGAGGLPVTGDKVKTLGVIGGVLLVGGVIATVVTRRRKSSFVA